MGIPARRDLPVGSPRTIGWDAHATQTRPCADHIQTPAATTRLAGRWVCGAGDAIPRFARLGKARFLSGAAREEA
ncbi:MAG: hypothetical protein IH895_00705 [Planctomycetes bacterium]|nr:hypothetical protein [Planctomycetota bacterium]